MTLPEAHSEQDRRILDDVRRFGWHVVVVPADDSSSGWAFTVGLQHSFQHSEFLMFGLTAEILHAALNNVAEDVRDGQRFEDGARSGEVLEGVECAFRSVEPHWYTPFLGYGLWFYGGCEFSVLQCLWPDRGGHLPWESSFRADWRELQPLLFRESVDAARTLRWLRSMDLVGSDDP